MRFRAVRQVVLDDGVIEGKRMLPDSWTAAANHEAFTFSAAHRALMPRIVSSGLHGYGCSWWIADDGASIANGFAGQRIYINRAQSLAIVTLGAFPQPRYQGPGAHDHVAEIAAFTEAVKQALKN